MIQGYFLSIAYLAVSALLLLVDYYRQNLSIMLRLRSLLEENGRALRIFFMCGIAIGLSLLFFPISPGPIVLGDLIPAVAVFISDLYIMFIYSDRSKDRSHFYYEGSFVHRKQIGFIFIAVAVFHFLFPSLILL